MYIVDVDTTPGCKTSRMITKVEHEKLYPEVDHSRAINYIFKHKIPVDIPEEQVEMLIEKYPTLRKTDEYGEITKANGGLKAELDGMKWNELKSYAVKKCGMPFKETNMKRDELTQKIMDSVG